MNKIASTQWLSDQNFLANGPTNFEQFSDKDLYQYCKKVGFNARIWSRKFMATIPEVAKRRLYKKYGYCSIHEFSAKMAGVSHDNVDEVLRVSEKFKELPKMKALIGDVGLSKLKVVACIATKDTDGFWAEKVKNMTKQVLEVYVREIKRKESEKTNYENIDKFPAFSIIENNIGSTIFQAEKIQNGLQKFPGELSAKNLEIPQEQKQINMFDSEKSISQNHNDARVENIQNHDKKTFTIQIDEKTEFELRKFKQKLEKEGKEPVDWNLTLKEMVRRALNGNHQKEIIKKRKLEKASSNHKDLEQPTTKSLPAYNPRIILGGLWPTRYIPAKIKHELKQKHNGHCAYRGCNKPAEQIHHQNRFALKHNHENLIPLCKIHHDFLHQSDHQRLDIIFNKFKTEKFVVSG